MRTMVAVGSLATVLLAGCGDSSTASTSAPNAASVTTTSLEEPADEPDGGAAAPTPAPCPIIRIKLAAPIDYFRHEMINVMVTSVPGGARHEESLPESELLFEDYIRIEWDRNPEPDELFWDRIQELFGAIGSLAEKTGTDITALGPPPPELELIATTILRELSNVGDAAAAGAAGDDFAVVLEEAKAIDSAVDMIAFAREGLATTEC